MKKYIVIPAYKEEKHIFHLVKEIKKEGYNNIIVVDDGSQDDTAKMAQEAGANVFVLPHNMGKGEALKRGFEEALKNGADLILTMDADGQHLPKEIKRFFDKYEETKSDVILGKRELGNDMPLIRIFVNGVTSIVTSIAAGVRIHDSQSGFRLFTRKVIENISLSYSRFQVESEMLIKAGRKGFRFTSVPISVVYGDEVSKINGFKDTLRFIKMIMEFLWKM